MRTLALLVSLLFLGGLLSFLLGSRKRPRRRSRRPRRRLVQEILQLFFFLIQLVHLVVMGDFHLLKADAAQILHKIGSLLFGR